MFKTKQLLNVFKPWGISERFYFRHMLRASRDDSVAKPRSMLNIVILDPWQRSLFSRQRTPGKEPLLAGKGMFFKDFAKTVQNTRNRSIQFKFKIKPVIFWLLNSQEYSKISQKVRGLNNDLRCTHAY